MIFNMDKQALAVSSPKPTNPSRCCFIVIHIHGVILSLCPVKGMPLPLRSTSLPSSDLLLTLVLPGWIRKPWGDKRPLFGDEENFTCQDQNLTNCARQNNAEIAYFFVGYCLHDGHKSWPFVVFNRFLLSPFCHLGQQAQSQRLHDDIVGAPTAASRVTRQACTAAGAWGILAPR